MTCVRTSLRNVRAREHVPELDLEFLLLSCIRIVDFDRDALAPFPPICAGAKGARLKRKCSQEPCVRGFRWNIFACIFGDRGWSVSESEVKWVGLRLERLRTQVCLFKWTVRGQRKWQKRGATLGPVLPFALPVLVFVVFAGRVAVASSGAARFLPT